MKLANINYKQTLLGLGLVGLWGLSACEVTQPPVEYNPVSYTLTTKHLTPPDLPADNPLTVDGVELGRMLFHEKALSKDGSISCASCHLNTHGFSDPKTFSEGVDGLKGHRQAMSVFNLAWNTNGFFWDGRAVTLREQALMPIEDPLEMQESLPAVVAKLQGKQAYKDQFYRAFGEWDITSDKIGLALEQFMLSIVSADSKYDQYLRGEVTLTAAEERGRYLFFNEYNPSFPNISGADCVHCHSGKNFENDDYMNNGLDQTFTDEGREKATNNPNDRGKFKVPTLRNIALTAPYMHDGRFTTLEEVINHYNTGLQNSSTLDPALVYPYHNGGLQLTQQDIQDLITFLHTLTDPELAQNKAYQSPFE